MEFKERVLSEIRHLRALPESTDTEYTILGLKRALEIFLGNDTARQYLTDNGESSN